MQGPRMQQTMPEDRSGWHQIDAGPHLEILFHPDRRLAGRDPDEIKRPSIMVAVTGKREQALRFDPFSMGAHYHIRPGLAEQIPLPVADGQTPLDATLAFFDKPLRFRGLLALAEEDAVASQLRDEQLKNAASQIRGFSAAGQTTQATALLRRIGEAVKQIEYVPDLEQLLALAERLCSGPIDNGAANAGAA